MAYAEDTQLLGAVRQSAAALGVASRWASGRPLRVADDFLYEMYLLFRVVEDLSARHCVKYVRGAGERTHEFPRKPAKKAGRPRFEVYDRGGYSRLYQLCAGTTVRDNVGKDRGVDLSVQRADASDLPDFRDVEQIYDAKYRNCPDDRITFPEFAAFAVWVDLLEAGGGTRPALAFTGLADLNANCLVTNGEVSTEPDAERALLGVREIGRFGPGAIHVSHG